MKTVLTLFLSSLVSIALYGTDTGEQLDFTPGNRGSWNSQDEGSGEISIDFTGDVLNVSVVNKTSYHFMQHWVKFFDISQNPYLAFDIKTDSTFEMVIRFADDTGGVYDLVDTIYADTVYTTLFYDLSFLQDTMLADSIRELQFNFPAGYTGNIWFDNFNMGDPASPYNHPPTVDSVDTQQIYINSGEQTVYLTGISDGDHGYQNITLTAKSLDTNIISHPDVTFLQGWSFAILKFTPKPDTLGSTGFIVKLKDDGNCDSINVDSAKMSFAIVINDINHAPLIDSIPDQSIFIEEGEQTIYLTGIADGDTKTQSITITAFSSDTSVIPHPDIIYTNGNDSAQFFYNPVKSDTNLVTITVKLCDDGGTKGNGTDSAMISFEVLVQYMIKINNYNYPKTPSIYPNPSNGNIVIKNPAEYRIHSMTVFDVNGNKLFDNILYTSNKYIYMEMNSLKSGIYFIYLQTESENYCKRLVIR